MKPLIPIAAGFLATSSLCCCGDFARWVGVQAGWIPPENPVPVDLRGLPTWPGAELKSAGTADGRSSAAFVIQDARACDVAAFYLAMLKDGGWAVESWVNDDTRCMVEAAREELTVHVIASTVGSNAEIVLTSQR